MSKRSKQITVDGRGEGHWRVAVPENLKAEIEEEAEELGFNSTSAAARYFIQIGREFEPRLNPQKKIEKVQQSEETTPKQTNPIHDHLPEDPDEAITIDELAERLDDYIFHICSNDDKVARDGREVYLK